MRTNLALPVSHHVAKREAGRSLRHAAMFSAYLEQMGADFITPTRDRFLSGDRLSSDAYGELIDRARETLGAALPIVLEEDVRQPTRTRPKGEQNELRAVARIGFDGPHSYYGLVGIRAYVNRKKVDFEYDLLGISATEHLLERAMQRELASWSGRFEEVDKALADSAGLAVVWRQAFATGGLRTSRIAMPIGGGLMLGNLTPSTVDRLSVRVSINRNGAFVTDMGKSAFHAPEHPDHPEMRYLGAAFATAIGDDAMNLAQDELRDALARFLEGNADLLARIGRAATWRASDLSEIATYATLAPGIEKLAGELIGLLDRPELDDALNHGCRQDEISWWNDPEGPGLRP